MKNFSRRGLVVEFARFLDYLVVMKNKWIMDWASGTVLVLTIVLFVIACFEKGFTHELLLEAGVFLVSVKLVLGGYKTEQNTRRILEKLETIRPTNSDLGKDAT